MDEDFTKRQARHLHHECGRRAILLARAKRRSDGREHVVQSLAFAAARIALHAARWGARAAHLTLASDK